MNPVFGHGHLRLYLLSLMEQQPRHGYELIQALSERFGGTYSPSAGTIYPRLSKLEEEGLVTKSSDGRKTVYSITDKGREELAARADQLNSIEDNLTDSVRLLADGVRTGVAEAMRSLRADLAAAARDARADETRAPRQPGGAPGTAAPDASGDPAASASDTGGTATDNSAEKPRTTWWSYGTTTGGARGTGSSGDTTDGTRTDGDATDGTRTDADPTDGTRTDGTRTDGTRTDGAPGSGPSTAEQQRRASNDALRDAEAALATFRATVRSDLRKQSATGTVSPDAVRVFTEDLRLLQAKLRTSLRA